MSAERVLIAVPCSVTTTASDDEFSIPTNTPGWNRGSHFTPLAGLASMCRIFSPNSRIGVLSLRPCSLCSSVFPSLPMSLLFIRYAVISTSQHSILASGGILVPMRCSDLLKGDFVGSARLAAAEERINRALADAVERHATKDPGVRGILKRASVVCHPESESQKKIARDTEQDPRPHPSVSHGGSSAASPQALT